MIFGRKLALWGPESTQKPYIDHPTQYGDIWQKVKKIGFLTSKIVIKNFSKSIFFADEARPPNQYWGSIHHIGAPKAPLSCCIGHTPSYRNLALQIPKKSKKPSFFLRKCCFCCFCCVFSVANVVFQNLQNLEILLPIFFIRRLVKKLFHFEGMFRQGAFFLVYIIAKALKIE